MVDTKDERHTLDEQTCKAVLTIIRRARAAIESGQRLHLAEPTLGVPAQIEMSLKNGPVKIGNR